MSVWKRIGVYLLVVCVVLSVAGCADLLEVELSQDAADSSMVEDGTTTFAVSTSFGKSTTTTTTRTTTTQRTTTTKATTTVAMVWIPTNGGKRYHRRASCSNMIDPEYVSRAEAEQLGFTPCGRCY